jgi:hypothetical protein
MSDEEFLARWSRRKQEARAAADATLPSPPAEPQLAAPPPDAVVDPTPEVVDLASLPPIDSIDAATDITAFLRKGIPQELSRAALRRAWSADPAIRDFIGLAENAWDFNDPNAMPGFGPLDCSAEQLQALIGRVIGSARSVAENLVDAPAGQGTGRQPDDSERTPPQQPEAISAHGASDETSPRELPEALAAVQSETSDEVASSDGTNGRRTHGGALPR